MAKQQDEHFDDLLERAAEALRRVPVPPGPPRETVARVLAAVRDVEAIPLTILERIRTMKRIAKIAVAASVLVGLGILVSWLAIGVGSGNIAFARVADALDKLRSATYDVKSEAKGEKGQPPATATGKGFFLAPAHQRIEMSVDIGSNPAVKAAAEAARRMHVAGSPAAKAAGQTAAEAAAKAVALMPKMKMTQITIVDNQAAKAIMLMPNMKLAVAMDMNKMKENTKTSPKGTPPTCSRWCDGLSARGAAARATRPSGSAKNRSTDARQSAFGSTPTGWT